MKTALKLLYDQVDDLNKKIALIKHYEATFASVHTADQHSETVKALALNAGTSLLRLSKPVNQLANIMEVDVPE